LWALDFQFDTTADGRTLKMLNVIYEFTRECPAIEIDRTIDADRVVAVLDRLMLEGGAPGFVGAVLVIDRADIPAVTQRQSLAESVTDRPRPDAPRQPAPTPRCEIPPEFATVAASAHEQLAEARAAIRHSAQRRHVLDELATALDRAAAAYEPHRPTLVAAERAATDARRAVADARRRLDNTDRRHRRERRRQLAATEQALGAATSNLERIEATAGGLRDLYNDLRSRHEAARRMVMHQEILDQWGNHESRAEQLEQLLDGIDTWTQWARGYDIPTDRLSRSAVTLDTHSRLSEQLDVRHVAETVRRWASRGGTELAHPSATWRARPVGPRRHGLDLGLGR